MKKTYSTNFFYTLYIALVLITFYYNSMRIIIAIVIAFQIRPISPAERYAYVPFSTFQAILQSGDLTPEAVQQALRVRFEEEPSDRPICGAYRYGPVIFWPLGFWDTYADSPCKTEGAGNFLIHELMHFYDLDVWHISYRGSFHSAIDKLNAPDWKKHVQTNYTYSELYIEMYAYLGQEICKWPQMWNFYPMFTQQGFEHCW